MAQRTDARSTVVPATGVRGRREQLLRAAAIVYLIAWAVHTADHARRGLGVVTPEVALLGIVAAVVQLAVIAAVLRRLP